MNASSNENTPGSGTMHLPTVYLYRQSLLVAGAVGLLSFTVFIVLRGVYVRQFSSRLRKMGLSFSPYHPVFGSLIAVKEVMEALPPDVNGQYMPMAIRRRYPEVGNVFYIDNWPFVDRMLITSSPSTAKQITDERGIPKWPLLKNYFRPIAGTHDLITMEGPLWKKWRSVFNPSFGATYLTTLVPQIVAEAVVFCEVLEERAKSRALFPLKQVTDNFTVDVIGKMVLNENLNSQRAPHPMINALRRQVQWLSLGSELNLWQRWHPIRPFVHWYNSRIMDAYVDKVLRDRFHAYSQRPGYTNNNSVVDRAIQTYMNDVSEPSTTSGKTKPMDATTRDIIKGQIRIFMFSGHDTTSASVCYCFYLLSKSKKDLDRIRAEHDEVFGSDLARAPAMISDDPHILNRLPFTLAVIKEALRLFPVASSIRLGNPGLSVVAEDGRVYPTNECLVFSSPHLIQRSPDFWPRADDFIPDRWLVPPGHELYPIKGAWRPFEFGPRNCIGQELALLEAKLVLALAIRRFDFNVSYEEWDRLHPKKTPQHVAGERAYLASNGGPSDGMPCRVTIRPE